jgi:hypothetical protein
VAPLPEPKVYSLERAACYVGLYDLGVPDPAGAMRRYVKKRLIEHVMIAGRIGFLKDQLDKFIEGRRVCRGGRGTR